MSREQWRNETRMGKCPTIFAGTWKRWQFILKMTQQQYSDIITLCINYHLLNLPTFHNVFPPHQSTLNQLMDQCFHHMHFKCLAAIAARWQRKVAWRTTWTININISISSNNSSRTNIKEAITHHSRIQWTSCAYDVKSRLMMKFRTFICKCLLWPSSEE